MQFYFQLAADLLQLATKVHAKLTGIRHTGWLGRLRVVEKQAI
jgi:hypothetical protein